MAYAVVHRFPGGTKEQYDASIRAVHPNDGRSLPEGQVFHVAGPSADGWTIVAIHDSHESWERFRNEKLMPTLSEGIEGGFPTPPEETSFPVHNQQTVRRGQRGRALRRSFSLRSGTPAPSSGGVSFGGR